MDSCIHVYEPVLLYKLRHCLLIYNNKNNYQVNAYCGYCCTKQSSK